MACGKCKLAPLIKDEKMATKEYRTMSKSPKFSKPEQKTISAMSRDEARHARNLTRIRRAHLSSK